MLIGFDLKNRLLTIISPCIGTLISIRNTANTDSANFHLQQPSERLHKKLTFRLSWSIPIFTIPGF